MPCLVDVSVLRGIELTSFKLILAVALFALLTAVIAAVLLPRTVPAATREKTADGPARPALRTVLRGVGRYTARTVMVSVPVLLVMVLAGLLINRPMHYVRTVGDAIEAASPRTQVVSRVTPLPEASAYEADPAVDALDDVVGAAVIRPRPSGSRRRSTPAASRRRSW